MIETALITKALLEKMCAAASDKTVPAPAPKPQAGLKA